MNVRDAAYHTVRDYPGGAASLAPRISKSASTLSHEVKPPEGRPDKLGLLDAVTIMALTGDHRMLYAAAAELGEMCLPLPQLEHLADGSAENLSAVVKEFADVLSEVSAGMADGHVSDNERARIERAWGELIAAGQNMLKHVAHVHAAGKPVITLRVAP